MSISINWATKIINIPIADLTPISSGIYELDVNEFRLILKELEESEDGMIFQKTHNHNTSIVLSGVTYSRIVEIINGYTITFEDGQYAVNIVGANSNVADVVNINQVSIRTANSAGLIVAGSGVTNDDVTNIKNAVWDEVKVGHNSPNSYGKIVQDLEKLLKQVKAISSSNL